VGHFLAAPLNLLRLALRVCRCESIPQNQHNRALAGLRVRIEQVIRCFKIFRIFSSRYRNRRKRFGLRLHLIAGLLNYELAHAS